MNAALAVGLVALVAAPGSAEPADTPAQALVRRVEARHRSVGDFVARFTQTYRSGPLGREIVESGTVSIKRPGRMRWEYRDPEPKTFVSDGRTFYFYVPADRQVIVREQAGDKRAPALLLAERSDVLAEFEASLEPAPAGVERLRLTPREPDPELDHVFVDVDRHDRIVGIEVLDSQGNRSRFRFEDIRENVGLSDDAFRFDIPQGVDVVAG